MLRLSEIELVTCAERLSRRIASSHRSLNCVERLQQATSDMFRYLTDRYSATLATGNFNIKYNKFRN